MIQLTSQKVGVLRFVAGAHPRDVVSGIIRKSSKPGPDGFAVHLGNAYTVALADTTVDYRMILDDGDAIICDGKPIQLISGLLKHHPKVHRLRGPSLFRSVLEEGREHGVRHFFLGGSPELLEDLVGAVNELYPGTIVCGTFSPPFRTTTIAEQEAQDAYITSCRPDIVWVGLGTPKQDYETNRIARKLGVTAIAVGAAFDFLSGKKKEAPRIVQWVGLEWAFRLFSEPRRLWRRYTIGGFFFFRSVMRNLR